MGMTMTQKILASHAGLREVRPGRLVECKIDLALGNDITAPLAINEFERTGAKEVFDRDRIALVPDHFVPNKDIASAAQARQMREFARKHGITHYYEVGRMGVEHALLPEQGLVAPGDLIIGADSHTCTYGALGAFSTGVGSTDLASAMATGRAWFRVPPAIRFELTGRPGPYVGGKDVILHIIGKIGVDGARYASMEFTGDGVASLTVEDRLCMANMAIEAGAKNGIFPADAVATGYALQRARRPGTAYAADEDAEYIETHVIDLSKVEPTVAFPHLPDNTRTVQEAEAMRIRIDQAVIGSCTNGRIEDMRAAAGILKGRRVHENVRLIVIPATQEIWRQCVHENLMDVFIDAGAAVSTPTCGPCLGGHMGILAEGERAVATTNRNFVGRMGHPKSEVYLASPAVAAASAVAGIVCGPEYLSKEGATE
ncbi:MAG: 3-isopropylmalate dehydratase large subunit [Christensenellales bacterium]